MLKTLALCLILILLAACAPQGQLEEPPSILPQSQTSTPLPEQVVTLVPATATPAPDNAGAPAATETSAAPLTVATAQASVSLADAGIPTTELRDDFAGFALDYPANWRITMVSEDIRAQSTAYTHSLRSSSATAAPKFQDSIPPDMAAIDVVVFIAAPATLDEAVQQRKTEIGQSEFPVEIVLEERWNLPSGLEAAHFVLDTHNGRAEEVIALVNGHMVLLGGMSDLSLYQPIARTLRPLN